VRTAITSGPAARHVHYNRALVDAIAVGSGTVLADDPLLTARLIYRERPLVRVVFDRRLRVSPGARLLSTLQMGPVIMVTSAETVRRRPAQADALEAAGATVLPLETCTMAEALAALAAREIQSLLVEGGAALHDAFWDAGLVDYVQLYVAPMALGPGGPELLPGRSFAPASLHESIVRPLGQDVLIEGYVHRPD
jgi:diaminohydroxyphosphoribosylaminopyrimidine deaminase/5-amino-6-(5-phosphoribosylamino)uracil reductase